MSFSAPILPKFYCYILKSSKTFKYYVGCTNDVESRLNRHNSKQVTSTAREVPWEIAYTETFDELAKARKRETQLKNWKSRAALERLIYNKI